MWFKKILIKLTIKLTIKVLNWLKEKDFGDVDKIILSKSEMMLKVIYNIVG